MHDRSREGLIVPSLIVTVIATKNGLACSKPLEGVGKVIPLTTVDLRRPTQLGLLIMSPFQVT